MANRTEFDDALRAAIGAAAAGFDPEKQGQFAVVPDGFNLRSLEEFQHETNGIRADHRFVDVDSLGQYLRKFRNADTMICADYEGAKISAVIDGDSITEPSHKRHKARFEAMQSDVLKAWLKVSGKGLAQVEFGLFLEDRAVDVIQPEAASIMEMVMTFDATKKVSFKSSQRLYDGQRQFQYVEENETRGAVTLPDHLIILAPVYRGMEPQRIKFMVRYRIEEGKLRFQIDMHDRDRVLREAFDRCVDALRDDMPDDAVVYVVG